MLINRSVENNPAIKDRYYLLIFILFSIGLRFFSFFPSVIDHDESTYMVTGMEMLRGKLLYRDLLDIKPVGIYLIYSLLISISNSVFFIRLITAVVIACSAFQLFKIKGHFNSNKQVQFLTGLTYIILLSLDPINKSDAFGLSGNTEIFFGFFTLLSINLLLKAKLNMLPSFVAGVFGGLGFIIKYLTIIELAGIYVFLFFVYFLYSGKSFTQFKRIFFSGFTYFIGFIQPFAASGLYYYLIDEYALFHFITFEAPGRYVSSISLLEQLDFVLGNHQMIITMLLFYMALLSPYRKREPVNHEKTFIVIWLIFSLVAMSSAGQQFNHYRIQSLSAIAFCIPNLLSEVKWVNKYMSRQTSIRLAYGYVLINLLYYNILYFNKYFLPRDDLNEMAAYINRKSRKNDLLLNRSDGKQVINVLTGLSTPSHIPHTYNLGNDEREYMLNVNREKECEFIFSSKPRFILGFNDVCGWKTYGVIYEKDTVIGDLHLFEKVN